MTPFRRSRRFPAPLCREPAPDRCPLCGFSPARLLFRTVECGTEGCKNAAADLVPTVEVMRSYWD